MEDIRLSKNFTYFELTITEHRKHLEQNRIEGQKYLMTAYKLAKELLQPIRDFYGKPLIVHSGFRCQALNKAIKGSKNSQHLLFEACDFHIAGEDLSDVFKNIRYNIKGLDELSLKWGQLILEGWSLGHPSWIHISLQGNRPLGECWEVLVFDGKNYIKVS